MQNVPTLGKILVTKHKKNT